MLRPRQSIVSIVSVASRLYHPLHPVSLWVSVTPLLSLHDLWALLLLYRPPPRSTAVFHPPVSRADLWGQCKLVARGSTAQIHLGKQGLIYPFLASDKCTPPAWDPRGGAAPRFDSCSARTTNQLPWRGNNISIWAALREAIEFTAHNKVSDSC